MMKTIKLTFCPAIVLAAVCCAQAANFFPGWGGRDAAVYKQAAEKSTSVNVKANNLMMYHFLNRKANTFAALCEIVDEICDDLYEKPAENAERKLTMKKMFAFCRGQFISEAVAFAEKNPSWYDLYLANVNKAQDNKRYAFLLGSYKRYFYYFQPDMHLKTLKNLAAWGKGGKVASVKKDFTGLKKHIERLSAKNKVKWEEVAKTYAQLLKSL